MSKSNRLFDLLQLLRRRNGPVSGPELAREADVSLRTIYRDIASLQAMGADIEGEPGFGYILKPGFMLPPLMFTQEELLALTLGAQWVSRQTDNGLTLAAQNAMGKIGSVLPSELRPLLNDNEFYVGRTQSEAASVDLQSIRQAMHAQLKLNVIYNGPTGSKTERIIWPIAIGFVESKRFVAAWCELRQDFRTFREDRIEQVVVLETRYPGRRRDLVKRWRALADKDRVKAATDGAASNG